VVQGCLVLDATAVRHQAVAHALLQPWQVPVREGHTDDWNVEPALLGHVVQRRDDLLQRQVAGYPEETRASAGSLSAFPGVIRSATCVT
jgi:hypothetical protein